MSKHPAKFSKVLWEPLADIIAGREIVLDPFAGVGTIHHIADLAGVEYSVGIELEREWAIQGASFGASEIPSANRRIVVGDSTTLTRIISPTSVDTIVTSPAYGNRLSDTHNAKDKSVRNTYKHQLGRDLSPNSGAGLVFRGKGTDSYCELHTKVYQQCWEVLEQDGLMVINISNFYRTVHRKTDLLHRYEVLESADGPKKRLEMDVIAWHIQTLLKIGFKMTGSRHIKTPRNRYGANNHVRLDKEVILIFDKL